MLILNQKMEERLEITYPHNKFTRFKKNTTFTVCPEFNPTNQQYLFNSITVGYIVNR